MMKYLVIYEFILMWSDIYIDLMCKGLRIKCEGIYKYLWFELEDFFCYKISI